MRELTFNEVHEVSGGDIYANADGSMVASGIIATVAIVVSGGGIAAALIIAAYIVEYH